MAHLSAGEIARIQDVVGVTGESEEGDGGQGVMASGI